MATADHSPEIHELDEQPVAIVAGRVTAAELPAFFDRSFTELFPALAEQGAEIVGAAFARYHGMPGEMVDLEVGVPTARPVAPSGSVVAGVLPAGRVATVVHAGSFEALGETWGQLATWIGEQGERPSETMWEVYLTEPSPDMDPDDLRTQLFWPLSAS